MWEKTHIRDLGDTTPSLPCRRCNHPTIHHVLARHAECRPGTENANHAGIIEDAWTICRCGECGSVGYLTRFYSSFDEYAMLVPMETWTGHREAWRWSIMDEEGEAESHPELPLPILRIMQWNIRHGGGRRVSDILARIIRHRPDVVVLTESRNDRAGESLRAGLADMGLWYQHSVSASDKANGVLIASREFVDTAQPLTAELEKPHMLLDAQVAGFGLVGVYMPNGDAKTPYWEAVVAAARERVGKPMLFIGDFNTGKHFLDEKGATLVSAPFMDRMEEVGFTDLWRSRHPDARESTWISNAGNGFRLDHAFASATLADRVTDIYYSHAERLDGISDHSALIVDIRMCA